MIGAPTEADHLCAVLEPCPQAVLRAGRAQAFLDRLGDRPDLVRDPGEFLLVQLMSRLR
jgi:hypothetical protein